MMEETNIKCVLCFLIIYDTYDNTKVCQWQRIIWCNLLNVKIKLYQEPITRSVHLHSIRDPTYAQVELIFRNDFCLNFCLHCSLYMTEIQKMVTKAKFHILLPFFSSIFSQAFFLFLHWFRPCTMRTAAETDVCGKQFSIWV